MKRLVSKAEPRINMISWKLKERCEPRRSYLYHIAASAVAVCQPGREQKIATEPVEHYVCHIKKETLQAPERKPSLQRFCVYPV